MDRGEKARYRGRHIGFVFQAYNLLPPLTAAENVAVPLLINGIGRREALQRAEALLVRAGLGSRLHALPKQLSYGQQQRVAITRALVHDPPLIVCDEPTSALDHETGQQVMELLRTTVDGTGRAVVVVTHDARIFDFADRIARMSDGRIEAVVSSPGELQRSVPYPYAEPSPSIWEPYQASRRNDIRPAWR
jgi:putative ABC transport system ATP-binding protein